MFSKNLLLSLGITSLAGIAIYFYFTQRIKKTEQKMNLMFDIIQEHKKATDVIYERLNNIPHNSNPGGLINVSDTEIHHQNQNLNNHSEDSDSDDDDDYTDSDVVSDNESTRSLKIQNENVDGDSLNLQQLPFNINGADSNGMMMMMGSIQLGQNIFENTQENAENLEIEYVDDNNNQEDTNTENLDSNLNEDVDNNVSQETSPLENVTDALSEENVQLHNDENSQIENNSSEPEFSNIENETASEISNVTANKVESDVDIHDPKTTVAQLKALAKSKNLRYRGLRKDKLVELLDNNM